MTKINLNDPNLQRLSHRMSALKNRALSVDLKSQIAILDAPYSFAYFFVIYLISPIASLIFLVMVLLALVCLTLDASPDDKKKQRFFRVS